MRSILLIVHRWLGLLMAGFLVLAGMTGCVMAWYYELDAAMNASFMRVATRADVQPLDPLMIRDRVASALPQAQVDYVDLSRQPGRADRLSLKGGIDPINGMEIDEVFVDPYSGRILGARKWGDLSQGVKNLMPFIYRVHHHLALEKLGTLILGVVGLLWTIDCFVGAYLTFPARQRSALNHTRRTGRGWWARWRRSWTLRFGDGVYKTYFDLHRAGGLWLWVMLFVIAWSSVAFNLKEVYQPVMGSMFAMQTPASAPMLKQPQARPGMSWSEALSRGRRLMVHESRAERFSVIREQSLSYDPKRALFRYRVKTDRDVNERWGQVSIWFDANNGERHSAFIPTGKAAGDTATTWLMALHMAALWGVPFKVFISVLGLGVAGLSVTGILIWRRKRRGRLAQGRVVARGGATV